MAKQFYYYKHHERQKELSDANPHSIVDHRRSFSQQLTYRMFWDLFLDAFCCTSKNFNGNSGLKDSEICELFKQIWPLNYVNDNMMFWRLCAQRFFVMAFESTSETLNQEITPYDYEKDTRKNPSFLRDVYEDLLMHFMNISDQQL